MLRILLFVGVFCLGFVHANKHEQVTSILKQNFSQDALVKESKMILKKKQIKKIQKKARAKIKLRVVYIYDVTKSNKELGYGVVISQRIRSKNATVLYVIDGKNDIKAVEVLSFKEPLEYKPSINWQKTLLNKNLDQEMQVGYDIPIISGATVSAKSLADSARIALALIEMYR